MTTKMASQFCRDLAVKVGYGDVCYKFWGINKPTAQKFLAVHGWLDNAGSFDPLMKHFLDSGVGERCVACVELPGHGWSSHLPKGVPFSPASDLQGVRSVVKQLGWSRFNLIGHSMGAMRTQAYAMCYPEEIESIITFDGVIIPLEFTTKDGNPYTAWGRQIDKFMKYEEDYSGKQGREHTWQELSDRWRAAAPGITEEEFEILMKRGCKKLENGKYIFTYSPALHNRTNAVLQQTMEMNMKCMQNNKDTPQLFIRAKQNSWETATDPSSEYKWKAALETLMKSYPNDFEILEFDGTHHFHMQHPKEISDLMNDFLKRHSKLTTDGPKL